MADSKRDTGLRNWAATICLPALAAALVFSQSARCQPFEPDEAVQAVSPQPALPTGKEIAIVFEDGPTPQSTALLLDALQKLGMKATFAVTGENVERNPGLAQRIVAEGHELANPSPAKLMRTVMSGTSPGTVILAHESFPKSAKDMPAVLGALAKNGFRLCTVSELHPPVAR